uniref:Uncharacterized protein n=1 Tax=Panagrolaimus sp. ES5 TaxID=591445 RepID=A0AC34GW06_9BILA
MVTEALLFVGFVSLTLGIPLINPVNNAYASLKISDLFRTTKTHNYFTVFDYRSHKEVNVFMDYKDKIIKDLLFCPRTFDNPLMGYFGRNAKKEHVMCIEILYQNTFTCQTTNLRAECKSLRAFENIMPKKYTIFETKAEMFNDGPEGKPRTAAFDVYKKKEEIKNAGAENGFFISETKLYIIVTTFFLTIIGVIVVCVGFIVAIRLMKKPVNQDRYSKTPTHEKSSVVNSLPRTSISGQSLMKSNV